jgi:transposase
MYMEVDMSEEVVPKRQYTEEFKVEAVQLADSVGGHEAARRFGIPIATLSNWPRFGDSASTALRPKPSKNIRRVSDP